MSYGELGAQSASIAASLVSVGGNRRVIVLSSAAERQIPALLGILQAKCTYVPVLPDLPAARLDFICAAAAPVAVLCDNEHRALAQAHFPNIPHLNGPNDIGAQHRGNGERVQLAPDHPAYIYFTSGSTGTPKGIVGRYAALGQFIQWEIAHLALRGPTKVAQLVSPMFDAFLRDVLLPLATGGTSCVPTPEARDDIGRLAAWLADSGAEVLHTVPSLFRALFGPASATVADFPALRHVLLSGEALLPSDVALWNQRLGRDVALYNLYGATETTMTKFCHRVSPSDAQAASVPIGRPIADTSAWIADRNLCPLEDGEIGEIVVETDFRSLGYLDDGKASSHVFVPVPGEPSRIVYRSGDLGRRRFDGTFEFLGREDRQVKIRGVRVEPVEIEEAARALSGVLDCVVDVESPKDGIATLVLYAVLTSGLTAADVRAHLQEQLPAPYMPSAVWACRDIPRLLSGKVDFAALRAAAKASRQPGTPPATPMEDFTVTLLRQLIGDQSIGVEDDFFDVGGHSLLAIQVLSRIREERRVEIPLSVFFAAPTARALAAYIESGPAPMASPLADSSSDAGEAKPIDLGAMSDQDLDRLLAELTGQTE